MILGWEDVDEKRQVIARPVKPSLGLFPSPYQAIRAWYRGSRWIWPWCQERKCPYWTTLHTLHNGSRGTCSWGARGPHTSRLLQGDNVPFSCNSFFDSTLFSTSRSWIPVVDAQPPLFGWAVGHAVIEEIFSSGWLLPSHSCLTMFCDGL